MRPMVIRTRKTSPKSNIGVAACTVELKLPIDGGAFRLLPAGVFRAKDGRPEGLPGWWLDASAGARLIGRVAQHHDDLVIDYEHQTLYTELNGQPAPAAGWINTQSLTWQADGIYAPARWTGSAKALITAEEYRYFSPVFTFDTDTGEVLDLLMGAITNYAALDGLADFAARVAARFSLTQPREEEVMDKETLLALGLKEDATEAEINAAIAALKARAETAEAKVAEESNRASQAETALAAAKAATGGAPDPAKYVPIETVNAMQTEIAALSARINTSEVNDLVDAAMAEGKILPAMEPWARDLGKKDIAQLKAYIDAAQPVAALKGNQTGGKGPEGEPNEHGLSAEEMAVCRATGIAPEDFKANRVA